MRSATRGGRRNCSSSGSSSIFGPSENAVKPQIWIAVLVHVLITIVKKRLNLNTSLYTLLKIFPSPSSRRFASSEHKAE